MSGTTFTQQLGIKIPGLEHVTGPYWSQSYPRGGSAALLPGLFDGQPWPRPLFGIGFPWRLAQGPEQGVGGLLTAGSGLEHAVSLMCPRREPQPPEGAVQGGRVSTRRAVLCQGLPSHPGRCGPGLLECSGVKLG